jgi:hypothetical protein
VLVGCLCWLFVLVVLFFNVCCFICIMCVVLKGGMRKAAVAGAAELLGRARGELGEKKEIVMLIV